MKLVHILKAALIVWSLVFTTFMILDLAKLKGTQQNLIAGILTILYAYVAATWYYKKGDTSHGIIIGLLMTPIILILDAIITIPFIMMPVNIGYADFYTDYMLWVLVAENILVSYLYWQFKVKRPVHRESRRGR